jgi:FkbM family methyltransferase
MSCARSSARRRPAAIGRASAILSIKRQFLRALGHLPVPGVRGVVWRLRGLLGQSGSGEFEVGFGELRYRGRLDDFIDWNVLFFGSYCPQELDFLAIAARVTGVATGGVTYFDVGANVGHHALFMSRHATEVVAFEPSQWVRERFHANIALNHLSNVRVFPVALGDSDGEGQLGSGFEGNSGSRSLTWTLDRAISETVVLRRGDDFLPRENLPQIDILKLDVEGYEKLVLRGLHQTLLKDRPVILMELIGKSEKSGFRDENELRASLYPAHELFSLRGNRKAKLTPFDWNGEGVVCLPQECAHGFRHIMADNGSIFRRKPR